MIRHFTQSQHQRKEIALKKNYQKLQSLCPEAKWLHIQKRV